VLDHGQQAALAQPGQPGGQPAAAPAGAEGRGQGA
jgi:hypothetical protein